MQRRSLIRVRHASGHERVTARRACRCDAHDRSCAVDRAAIGADDDGDRDVRERGAARTARDCRDRSGVFDLGRRPLHFQTRDGAIAASTRGFAFARGRLWYSCASGAPAIALFDGGPGSGTTHYTMTAANGAALDVLICPDAAAGGPAFDPSSARCATGFATNDESGRGAVAVTASRNGSYAFTAVAVLDHPLPPGQHFQFTLDAVIRN